MRAVMTRLSSHKKHKRDKKRDRKQLVVVPLVICLNYK